VPLSIEIAISKTHKYASRDSGDTAETVERPTGGLSVVLVDGQGSGQAAKSLSMMVSSKAVTLLKEGVRDGAVARGTHDFLHAFRHGKVSATLDIVSVDLASSTVVVTRNSGVTYYIVRDDDGHRASESVSGPIGLYRHTRPAVDQFEFRPGLQIIVFSDGIATAGIRSGKPLNPTAFAQEHFNASSNVQEMTDALLQAALDADDGRPSDDMTVVALALTERETGQPIRRQYVSVPMPR
jgi:serine phosphatase RsbU (regulator of sigma subunit)